MRTRLSICNRKARYPSGEAAQLAATHATIPLRPYRCDRCRQYHLTSRTKGKRVPDRQRRTRNDPVISAPDLPNDRP
ncbi:MAG: hypothetical protein ACR2FK_03040 [Sphingomicrobium sp.]